MALRPAERSRPRRRCEHAPDRGRWWWRSSALLASFGLRKQFHFHDASGRGYQLLADRVCELDPHNPHVAARLVGAFNPWRRLDAGRQAVMRAQLERLAGKPGLSKSVHEIVGRALR